MNLIYNLVSTTKQLSIIQKYCSFIPGINCPDLQAPTNGDVTCDGDNSNYGSTCSFTCDEGFAIVGSSNLTCTNSDLNSVNGTWTDQSPLCEGIETDLFSSFVSECEFMKHKSAKIRHK